MQAFGQGVNPMDKNDSMIIEEHEQLWLYQKQQQQQNESSNVRIRKKNRKPRPKLQPISSPDDRSPSGKDDLGFGDVLIRAIKPNPRRLEKKTDEIWATAGTENTSAMEKHKAEQPTPVLSEGTDFSTNTTANRAHLPDENEKSGFLHPHIQESILSQAETSLTVRTHTSETASNVELKMKHVEDEVEIGSIIQYAIEYEATSSYSSSISNFSHKISTETDKLNHAKHMKRRSSVKLQPHSILNYPEDQTPKASNCDVNEVFAFDVERPNLPVEVRNRKEGKMNDCSRLDSEIVVAEELEIQPRPISCFSISGEHSSLAERQILSSVQDMYNAKNNNPVKSKDPKDELQEYIERSKIVEVQTKLDEEHRVHNHDETTTHNQDLLFRRLSSVSFHENVQELTAQIFTESDEISDTVHLMCGRENCDPSLESERDSVESDSDSPSTSSEESSLFNEPTVCSKDKILQELRNDDRRSLLKKSPQMPQLRQNARLLDYPPTLHMRSFPVSQSTEIASRNVLEMKFSFSDSDENIAGKTSSELVEMKKEQNFSCVSIPMTKENACNVRINSIIDDERQTSITPSSNTTISTDDAEVLNELSAYMVSSNLKNIEEHQAKVIDHVSNADAIKGQSLGPMSYRRNNDDFDTPTPTNGCGAKFIYEDMQSAKVAVKAQATPTKTMCSNRSALLRSIQLKTVDRATNGKLDHPNSLIQHSPSEYSPNPLNSKNVSLEQNWVSDGKSIGRFDRIDRVKCHNNGENGRRFGIKIDTHSDFQVERIVDNETDATSILPYEHSEFQISLSYWKILPYISALNFLSDWTCFSVAPITRLTAEVFDDVDPVNFVTAFLLANIVAYPIQPAVLKQIGSRKTVVVGSFMLMLGSIIKSGGAPIFNTTQKIDGWKVYLGIFIVGLSQPFYQCIPALLANSWMFESKERLALCTVLQSSQLGITSAFVCGTLLVNSKDDLLPYFQFLSLISSIVFCLVAMFFDGYPSIQPSVHSRFDNPMNKSYCQHDFESIYPEAPSAKEHLTHRLVGKSTSRNQEKSFWKKVNIATNASPCHSPFLPITKFDSTKKLSLRPDQVDVIRSPLHDEDKMCQMESFKKVTAATLNFTQSSSVVPDPITKANMKSYGSLDEFLITPRGMNKKHFNLPDVERVVSHEHFEDDHLQELTYKETFKTRGLYDQTLHSMRMCFSISGFPHCILAFTTSGIVINALNTSMDYLLKFNDVSNVHVRIVGAAFQVLIMLSSTIVFRWTGAPHKYYYCILASLVLGSATLYLCSVARDKKLEDFFCFSLLLIALLTGLLQSLSTQLGAKVIHSSSGISVFFIQQLFSKTLSAAFIQVSRMIQRHIINDMDDALHTEDMSEYKCLFYLLILIHVFSLIYFLIFNGVLFHPADLIEPAKAVALLDGHTALSF